LLILLLLSWVLRFLSRSTGRFTLNLLLFSNDLFLFVNFLKLGVLGGDYSFTLRDFSSKSFLSIGCAIVVADFARS
jgi:hypothetical protein